MKKSLSLVGLGVIAALVFSVLAVPQQAYSLAKYKVTVSTPAGTVVSGTAVKLTGKFSIRKKSKRTLTLQFRPAWSSSWTRWNSLTATKKGKYTAWGRANETGYWRVCKAKDKKGKAACSAQRLVTVYAPPDPAPTTVDPPSTDYRYTNTAGAATMPQRLLTYQAAIDVAQQSQQQKDEGSGFFTGAAPVGDTPITISSLSAASGSLSGGETITVYGSGLNTVTGIKMAKSSVTTDFPAITYPADSIAVRFKRVSATELQFHAPAWGWGASTLTLVNGSYSASAAYTYGVVDVGSSDLENAYVSALNAVRATGVTCGHGTVMPPVSPISMDGTISDLARNYSADLVARSDKYSTLAAHQRYGALAAGLGDFANQHGTNLYSYYGTMAGNVGGGDSLSSYSTAAAGSISGFMQELGNATDGHCQSLMSATITKIGVGVAHVGNGGYSVTITTK